tara:strand:+ start:732 stop:851 length:120 start_codon:yes stop_codon:yes gene_type:complete
MPNENKKAKVLDLPITKFALYKKKRDKVRDRIFINDAYL